VGKKWQKRTEQNPGETANMQGKEVAKSCCTRTHTHTQTHTHTHTCVCDLCVCVCVCVCERKKDERACVCERKKDEQCENTHKDDCVRNTQRLKTRESESESESEKINTRTKLVQ
jgi:hypothetical protein